MAKSRIQMTQHEWQRVLPLMGKIAPERLAAAHKHLVKGLSLARAGEAAGMFRQDVHDVVRRVLSKSLALSESDAVAHGGVPKGWLRLTVDVPKPMARYVRRFAAAVAHGESVEAALAAHTPKKTHRATAKAAAMQKG
jgi:hypothetical protein